MVDKKTHLKFMEDGEKAWLSNGSSSPEDETPGTGKAPPHFTKNLTNSRLITGLDIILTCTVAGKPTPNVRLCISQFLGYFYFCYFV